MDPYRPLYRVDETRTHVPEPCDHEERALIVLLVVLGLARVIPAVWSGEDFGTETTVALIMLIAGLGLGVRRWRMR